MILLKSAAAGFLALLLFQSAVAQTGRLKTDIEEFLKTKQADVGVAIMDFDNGELVVVGGDTRYAMQSVYKFHLALAVLHKVGEGEFALDQRIRITKQDLLPDTWSPLRDRYPDAGIELPLSEILAYTVSQSDNNGCDILFRLVGGTKEVEEYIHGLGVHDVSIKSTEEEMHKAWDVQFTNWTTPVAAVQLLELFYRRSLLSSNGFDFLWKIMVETSTGPKRIRGSLPAGTIVAHKTGTSGRDNSGVAAAVNDIGIVTLPDGRHCAIAVFVSNSKENDETNELIIARIAQMCWNSLVARSH
ncbi:MAG: class A beta-lactamase, subclass A2 [Bacteroidetes bacterium]|nr:class A beta-lactamase, subclass A2 [Bacteroidota bacterium]MCW5895666.1 class A beta-lactamase, subclass A2 [Bacteroidota bacterium]